MDGVAKNEFFKPTNIGYSDEVKKMIVDESGDKLKMKEVFTDHTAAYNESIKKADELLNEKKYTEAKSLYEKALTFKPTEEYPKSKIEKINSVLSSIEELHKNTF
jgi:hypothetical protein